MIGFFSGDLVRGSLSSSKVLGLRQESGPLDLVTSSSLTLAWDRYLLPVISSLAGDFRPCGSNMRGDTFPVEEAVTCRPTVRYKARQVEIRD